MRIRELLSEGTKILKDHGVPDAGFDARQILYRSFSLDTAKYLMVEGLEVEDCFSDSVVREAMLKNYWSDIEKRARRIPLQQILGESDFYGLRFFVNEYVLCPRPDTEILVDQVIHDYENEDKSKLRVLDMCTGSGCIGISIAKVGGFTDVWAADISEEALRVAKKNAEDILEKPGNFHLVQSDLFSASDLKKDSFDILLSNPPYIPTEDIRELDPEVRDHEPILALDGSEDGLYFYRRIADEAGDYLRKNGRIYVEIGYDQGKTVKSLFENAGFTDVLVLKDFGENDRVVTGKKQ